MFAAWMSALEATGLASGLRNSVWAYPLVNAGHLLGVALLVGGTVPLNLRLLGLWRSVPLVPLGRVLTRTADAGLGLAVLFGLLLFATRAGAYVESWIFLAKMLVLAAGILDTLVLRRMTAGAAGRWNPGEEPPAAVRLASGMLLALWLAALLLGRLIGYF